MTQKDYRMIAECINEAKQNQSLNSSSGEETLFNLTVRFMTMLDKDNPRFKPSLFEKACGY
jgi:hypothetical protein